MKNSVLVTELSPEDLQVMMERIIRKVLGEQSQPNKSRVESQLMNDDELEKLMGVSKTTLYLWRRDGKLPYQRIGKKIFYKITDVERAMGLTGEQEPIRQRRSDRRKEGNV